jgi:radical SAM superfamily enzyme YgiQ (UPF0313 family)
MDGVPRKPQVSARIWLADLAYNQQSVSSETMPQAVAGLATFAGRFIDLIHPVRVFKYPDRLSTALREEGPPDVIGFGHYIWNSYLARAFASHIKRSSPRTIVVFGGPHFPLDPSEKEEFLRQNPQIDFYVEREGERGFTALLQKLAETGWDKHAMHGEVASVCSLRSDGTPFLQPPGERVTDLAEIPSPYLAGMLDEFFDGKLVPTLTTNRGCPFSCTFCLEGERYFSKVYRSPRERVRAELHYMGSLMKEVIARDGRNELLITDSNFGMLPDDRHTCEVIAECQDRYGWPERVNVTTGKNNRERVLSAIGRARGAILMSGAVQSLDKDVLANIKRTNISADGLMDIALAAAQEGAGTYSDVVLGLPGDTVERHFATLEKLMAAGFDYINTFQLALLPGSELATKASRERFGLKGGFRMIPRGYGLIDLGEESIVVAEIDEVCVSSDSMSFDDHLRCRLADLAVFIGYNDRAFAGTLTYLRARRLNIFRWVLAMADQPVGDTLRSLFEEFTAETVDGVWESRAELERHIAAPENAADVREGRLASNLLYGYRARALTETLDDLASTARCAAIDQACATEHDTPAEVELINDIVTFDRARLHSIFDRSAAPVVRCELRYDVPRFLAESGVGPAEEYRLSAERTCEFIQTEEQRRLVARYARTFGTDAAAIGRMLSRITLGDLLRRPMWDAAAPAEPPTEKAEAASA